MKNKIDHDVPLSIVLLFSLIFFIYKNPFFIYIGFGVGILTLLSENFNYYLTAIWKKLLAIVGTVNAHVILSFVFFVVLFPMAFLFRLFNKDPLNLNKSNSAFVIKDKTYQSEDFDNPW